MTAASRSRLAPEHDNTTEVAMYLLILAACFYTTDTSDEPAPSWLLQAAEEQAAEEQAGSDTSDTGESAPSGPATCADIMQALASCTSEPEAWCCSSEDGAYYEEAAWCVLRTDCDGVMDCLVADWKMYCY